MTFTWGMNGRNWTGSPSPQAGAASDSGGSIRWSNLSTAEEMCVVPSHRADEQCSVQETVAALTTRFRHKGPCVARDPNQRAFITDNIWIMVGTNWIIGAQSQPFEPIVDELVSLPFGCFGGHLATGSGTTTTAGTKMGESCCTEAACLRVSRHQAKTCCGLRPCRRATSEMVAFGSSVSAMIRDLSSTDQ